MTAPVHVILVDENDEVVGEMEKIEAHRKGLLHRAISVFIFNKDQKLLLQRRSQSKFHSSGLWTNTCSGHPLPGETPLQAAERRLLEEMGVACKLEKRWEVRYELPVNNELIENEYGHVYFGQSDALPAVNPDDADDYTYLSLNEVQQQVMDYPSKFTPWFKLLLPDVILHR
ncbi:isopentenyl-diphosphate delta-isomerase [Chitinophaga skermanii]|uniref:Isopentenyl-diphosphate delta-isomerase n=1 Tax=Chitinophaga skermanii TaxID=331697 RepID=A0A327Q6U6_9BACT|nr:isopentenyl-diphosphate Delta-isomerase [Chitinophaga skermanii]RAI99704.1 isopentenyl-diphosphate delta-isomerase [Chitinophaga skermanii]